MVFLVLSLGVLVLTQVQNKAMKDSYQGWVDKREYDKVVRERNEWAEGARRLEKSVDELKRSNAALTRELEELKRRFANVNLDEKNATLLASLLQDLQADPTLGPHIEVDVSRYEVKFKANVLFPSGIAELTTSEESLRTLRTLVVKISNKILADKRFVGDLGSHDKAGIIERIVVEGGTDTRGAPAQARNFVENLDLSLKRAQTLTNYIANNCDFKTPEARRNFFLLVATSGRSHSDYLLAHPDPGLWEKARLWERDDETSRRVSIRLQLRSFGRLKEK